MKVLATYNIKGGVGKTASAVNLSYLAARSGLSTLVWDLDPQGAATFYYRIKPKVKGGARKLVKGKTTLGACVRGTDFEGLDLIPADFSYRHMDLELDSTKKPTGRLHRLIEPFRDEYDVVFLDCPPSISLVSESVFRAADALLVPSIPTVLSIRTLEQLAVALRGLKTKSLEVLPFWCMVDRRKRLHRDLCQAPPSDPFRVLSAAIPSSSDVEKMGLHRSPIETYAHRSVAARAYRRLWDEVAERTGLK
jgi:chromosome partitioning protein